MGIPTTNPVNNPPTTATGGLTPWTNNIALANPESPITGPDERSIPANAVAGNKPVTIGHQYSTVGLRSEPEPGMTKSWMIPMSTQRVATDQDKELVGARQMQELLADPDLPWHEELVVEVGDTSYSKPAYLHANREHDNLVTIARVRSSRTFYRQFVYPDGELPRHRPRRYGEPFNLPDPMTWHPPDQKTQFSTTSRRGKTYTVEIQAWHNMLMPGKNKPERIPM